jgi:hypothetical protein
MGPYCASRIKSGMPSSEGSVTESSIYRCAHRDRVSIVIGGAGRLSPA